MAPRSLCSWTWRQQRACRLVAFLLLLSLAIPSTHGKFLKRSGQEEGEEHPSAWQSTEGHGTPPDTASNGGNEYRLTDFRDDVARVLRATGLQVPSSNTEQPLLHGKTVMSPQDYASLASAYESARDVLQEKVFARRSEGVDKDAEEVHPRVRLLQFNQWNLFDAIARVYRAADDLLQPAQIPQQRDPKGRGRFKVAEYYRAISLLYEAGATSLQRGSELRKSYEETAAFYRKTSETTMETEESSDGSSQNGPKPTYFGLPEGYFLRDYTTPDMLQRSKDALVELYEEAWDEESLAADTGGAGEVYTHYREVRKGIVRRAADNFREMTLPEGQYKATEAEAALILSQFQWRVSEVFRKTVEEVMGETHPEGDRFWARAVIVELEKAAEDYDASARQYEAYGQGESGQAYAPLGNLGNLENSGNLENLGHSENSANLETSGNLGNLETSHQGRELRSQQPSPEPGTFDSESESLHSHQGQGTVHHEQVEQGGKEGEADLLWVSDVLQQVEKECSWCSLALTGVRSGGYLGPSLSYEGLPTSPHSLGSPSFLFFITRLMRESLKDCALIYGRIEPATGSEIQLMGVLELKDPFLREMVEKRLRGSLLVHLSSLALELERHYEAETKGRTPGERRDVGEEESARRVAGFYYAVADLLRRGMAEWRAQQPFLAAQPVDQGVPSFFAGTGNIGTGIAGRERGLDELKRAAAEAVLREVGSLLPLWDRLGEHYTRLAESLHRKAPTGVGGVHVSGPGGGEGGKGEAQGQGTGSSSSQGGEGHQTESGMLSSSAEEKEEEPEPVDPPPEHVPRYSRQDLEIAMNLLTGEKGRRNVPLAIHLLQKLALPIQDWLKVNKPSYPRADREEEETEVGTQDDFQHKGDTGESKGPPGESNEGARDQAGSAPAEAEEAGHEATVAVEEQAVHGAETNSAGGSGPVEAAESGAAEQGQEGGVEGHEAEVKPQGKESGAPAVVNEKETGTEDKGVAPKSHSERNETRGPFQQDISRWLDPETVEVGSDASFVMATLASSGIVPKLLPLNPEKAVQELRVAAETGSLQAVMALGNRYLVGRGVPLDCPVSLHYLQTAATKLFQEAQASGSTLLPKDPVSLRDMERDAAYAPASLKDELAEEVDLDEDLAMRGMPEYQRQMGYRHLVGQGVDQNPDNALRNFQAAAAAGDQVAMFNLGYMHMKGIGAPVNYTQAQHLFIQATQGPTELPAALNGLGVLHFNGWGVPVNYTRAFRFFHAAAMRRDPDALFNLGSMYYNGLGVGFPNASKALGYFQKAMDEGHWQAPLTLAEILHSGAGGLDPDTSVPSNCSRAARLYSVFISERSTWARDLREAALAHRKGDSWRSLLKYLLVSEEGSRVATENAGALLKKGMGYRGADRYDLALGLFLRAAKANSTAAMIEAALIQLYHPTAEKDKREEDKDAAVSLLVAAADRGDVEALFHLAYLKAVVDGDFDGARLLLKEGQGLCRKGECFALGVASAAFEVAVLLEAASSLLGVDSFLGFLAPFTPLGSSAFEPAADQHHLEYSTAPTDIFSLDRDWDTWLLFLLSFLLGAVFWQLGQLRQRAPRRRAEGEGENGTGENGGGAEGAGGEGVLGGAGAQQQGNVLRQRQAGVLIERLHG